MLFTKLIFGQINCDSLLSILYQFSGNATDISGNNNHGIIQGNAQISDVLQIPSDIESALIIPSSSINGAIDFSVTFRVFFDHLNLEPTIHNHKPRNTFVSGWSGNNYFNFAYGAPPNEFYVAFEGEQYFFDLDFSLVENQWYCLAITREENILRIYIEGEQISMDEIVTNNLVNLDENGLVLGQDQDCLTGCYEVNHSLGGRLDNFRIYKRALNINELTILCQKVQIDEIICDGEDYFGYVNTGVYEDNFISSSGCDSIRILNLTVIETMSSYETITICEGEEYEGYSNTGIYMDTLSEEQGCYSIRTIDLEVKQHQFTYIDTTICVGNSYVGYFESGIYEDLFYTEEGCDSTRILTLSIVQIIEFTVVETICHGGYYDGYTESGVYLDTILLEDCDRIRTLKLNVNSVFIPNAFSPNGDGTNDYFQVFSKNQDIKILTYQIFDRWGGNIYGKSNFKISDFDAWWDGTYNNKELNSGVYIYYIEIECMEELISLKGEITIIK